MAARAWEFDLAWIACPVPGCPGRRERGHVLCWEHWTRLPAASRGAAIALVRAQEGI